MATTRVDGRPEQTTPTTRSAKCNCCPYGFHIDLGFVDFVENVANGASSGASANDGFGSRRNSIKGTPGGTSTAVASNGIKTNHCNGMVDKSARRALISPLDSIFSDSLENVVSDFEETVNLRGCNSDRESMRRLQSTRNDVVRSNGYFSDYGTTQINRSLPPRIPGPMSRGPADRMQINRPQGLATPPHHDAATSSRKPPLTPSGTQQHAYRTALGRTMSEIKSKHHDERDDDLRRTLFTANGYRRRDSSARGRTQDISSFRDPEQNRSLYEQGKAHYLGSRTPDMPRRSFTLTPLHNQYPSDTESLQLPSWRIRSPVPRSSSAVDMDRFVSMRRRKLDDNVSGTMDPKSTVVPPLPYPRNCSLYAERLRRELSSPPHLSGNSSSSTEKYPTSRSLNEMKVASRSRMSNAPAGGTKGDSVELTNGNVLMVDSKDDTNNAIDASGPCLQCCNLQKKLSDLSRRLQQATNEMNDRAAEELRKQREKPIIIDRSIGSSCPLLNDVFTETIKVENKDAAGDALHVEIEDKRTSVSLADRAEMHWHNDIASSPIPQPRSYSIGVATDKPPAPPPRRDAMTDTPIQELLASRAVCHVGCHTEPTLTNDRGCGSDVPPVVMCDFSSVTDRAVLVDSGTGSKQTISALKDSSSMTSPVTLHSRPIQTEHIGTSTICISTSPVPMIHRGVEAMRVIRKDSCTICDDLMSRSVLDASTEMDVEFNNSTKEVQQKIHCATVALQTEFEQEPSEPRVLNDSEIAESLWLMPSKATKDVAVGNDEDVIDELELTPTPDSVKLNVRKEQALDKLDNSDDEDTICVVEESLSDPEAIDFESCKSAEQSPPEQRIADDVNALGTEKDVTEVKKAPRALGQARAAIVKKMLTEKSPQLNFIRGTATSKSWRTHSKKGDSLQYIADQHKTQNGSMPSTPQTTSKGALKEKVILKKDVTPPPMPPSKVPEPVPARIPRPKISKYTPGETVPQSPDEEAEIADRLTPLRSEMRTLRTYSNGRMLVLPRTVPPSQTAQPRLPPPAYSTNKPIIVEDSTSSSSDSEGSYDTNEAGTAAQFELTPQLSEAIEILKKHFQKSDVDPTSLDWATKHAKHEWLKTAARKTASATQVEGFIDFLEAASDAVLKFVVNLTDPNENTALHYAVSHGNFDVVSILLDSHACNLDRANKAGYTAVMLAALCDATDEVEAAVIHRLFQLGDVNAQAVQHGQTALMLSVSHGKMNTTKLLIDCQADLNIQDEEGSTALMCAAEHGHKEIVKLLLAQSDIDASLSDCDSSTALSIAVENGHRDIGVLIYAHLNHACKKGQPNKESTS